jgi:hypothetical protein
LAISTITTYRKKWASFYIACNRNKTLDSTKAREFKMTEVRIWSLWKIMKVFDAWGLAMLLTHMNSADRQAQMDVLQGERDNQVPADFMQTFGIEGLAAQALHHAKVAGLPSTYDRVTKERAVHSGDQGADHF